MKSWALVLSILALGSLLLSGCSDKPVAQRTRSTTKQTSTPSARTNSTNAAPEQPYQRCFACEARGIAPCHALNCNRGLIDCPAPCLKLSHGKWEHLKMPGHGPSELWQKLPNGPGKTTAWNQSHLGEVIVIQNGIAVNTGKCSRCGGAAKINCRVCAGRGQITCEFCGGSKVLPATWKPNDNPVLNRQPDLIRLRDGRVILGRAISHTGTKYTIKTRDGKLVDVNVTDVLGRKTFP